MSKEGTFRLIIEDSSNNIVGNLDYIVTATVEDVQGSLSLNWEYSKDNGLWTNFSTTSSLSTSFSFSEAGIYRFRVTVTDSGKPIGQNISVSSLVTNVEVADYTFIYFNSDKLQVQNLIRSNSQLWNHWASSYCSGLDEEGYSDWRTPNQYELTEIYNVWNSNGRSVSSLEGINLGANFRTAGYWATTSGSPSCYSGYNPGIPFVNFSSGSVGCGNYSSSKYNVFCVRDR
ncbi:MAG: DUF1566 domain-containing protein [Candidatus ainarchaeum sp.]|nr:DUF1566 domain-containing protein [Candidatus ainarchaeum sp.]